MSLEEMFCLEIVEKKVISRLSMIVRVVMNVVLNRTVVVDSD